MNTYMNIHIYCAYVCVHITGICVYMYIYIYVHMHTCMSMNICIMISEALSSLVRALAASNTATTLPRGSKYPVFAVCGSRTIPFMGSGVRHLKSWQLGSSGFRSFWRHVNSVPCRKRCAGIKAIAYRMSSFLAPGNSRMAGTHKVYMYIYVYVHSCSIFVCIYIYIHIYI